MPSDSRRSDDAAGLTDDERLRAAREAVRQVLLTLGSRE